MGNWGNWNYSNMMGNWAGGSGNWGLFSFLGTATWIAFFLFLVLGIIYFWKGIKKRGK